MTHSVIRTGWLTALAAVGGVVTTLLGTWSLAMTILCVCMAVDYISGLVVAGVFHASLKSAGGGLDSNVGWKGLVRKVATLAVILIAHFVDLLIGTQYIRDAVVIFFTLNEILSILENCALMGVPIPKVLISGLDILKKESKEDDDTGHVTVLAYSEYTEDGPVEGTREEQPDDTD